MRIQITLPIQDKECCTKFRVVRVDPSGRYGSVTTVDLWPITGRFHQLRYHMAKIGHPIIGEPRHGRENLAFLRGRHKSEPLCLWSLEIKFEYQSLSSATEGEGEGPAKPMEILVEIPEPGSYAELRQREQSEAEANETANGNCDGDAKRSGDGTVYAEEAISR